MDSTDFTPFQPGVNLRQPNEVSGPSGVINDGRTGHTPVRVSGEGTRLADDARIDRGSRVSTGKLEASDYVESPPRRASLALIPLRAPAEEPSRQRRLSRPLKSGRAYRVNSANSRVLTADRSCPSPHGYVPCLLGAILRRQDPHLTARNCRSHGSCSCSGDSREAYGLRAHRMFA